MEKVGTSESGGYKIFSVTGHVQKPGNYEIPLGTSFQDLLDLAGGMIGHPLKGVIPGGSSTPILPASVAMHMHMDYQSVQEAGSMLGCGGVIIMDERTCMACVLCRIARFYFHESCGKCTPCREGWLWRIIQRITNGEGNVEDLDNLERVANSIQGRTICALGDAAVMPVKSFLKHFKSDFLHHIHNQTCPK